MCDMTVSERQSKAAKKAWKTMRKAESLMTEKELKALDRKRSNAAYKAWETIRGNRGM